LGVIAGPCSEAPHSIASGGVAPAFLLRWHPTSAPPLAVPQSKHGQLLAVGRAREGGIEVAGTSKLLGYTAFEDVSGGGLSVDNKPSIVVLVEGDSQHQLCLTHSLARAWGC
jgi:hypothetical protein